MALKDYLTTEVALDHNDGILTRREALRRLGLMGLSLSAGAALLAACSTDGPSAAASSSTAAGSTAASAATSAPTATAPPAVQLPSTTTVSTTPVSTTTVTAATSRTAELIKFTGAAGMLIGAYAAAATPKGAVLIIHENKGLTPHFKALPSRFAASGYSALALDLLSRQGGTDAIGDEGKATAALAATPQDQYVADMKSALDELARRVPGVKLATIGFCFGGGQIWSLLAAGEPRLAAAAPFYGPGVSNPDFTKSKAAVLGVYAEKDSRVNGTKDAMDAALTTAGLVHAMKVFPGVDHAFFNETGARYDATQAAAAYQAVLDWFASHL